LDNIRHGTEFLLIKELDENTVILYSKLTGNYYRVPIVDYKKALKGELVELLKWQIVIPPERLN